MAVVPRNKLESELRALVAVCDFNVITVKDIRKQLEEKLELDLKPQKDEVRELVSALVLERQAAEEEDEEAAEASEDDNSELDFDASSSSAAKKQKKKPPSSAEESFKWNLSPALMTFLDVQVSEMPFREAQTLVQDYVRALPKDPTDGRKHVCDEKMHALFGIKRITMFGIGKHLKKHIKKWVDVAPADDDDDSDNDGHAPPPKKSGAKRAAPSSASKPATKKKAVIKAKGSSGGDDEKKARKPGGFACTPYALSPIMARVTGETQLPRPQVVKKLWEYIKANELQNPSNKSEIHCDKLLAELFGQKMVTMFSMNKFIGQHLTKIET